MKTIDEVERVEVDEHRWYVLIRVVRKDGKTDDLIACADGEHSGIWFGRQDLHGEHW